MFSFLILTTTDLPEAYFLGSALETLGSRFSLINIVGRPARDQLRVLWRLRRNRGLAYAADVVFGRVMDRFSLFVHRKEVARAPRAFPEVDGRLVRRIRDNHPHLDCRDPHTGDVLDFVRARAPDYILLAGAPLLRPAFYGLARHGTLNRHLGLLPDFRGVDCAIWALALDQPENVGYSIHVVNERVDAGEVVLRQPMPIAGDPTLEDYLRRLRREASQAFVDLAMRLAQGAPLESQAQTRTGRYYPPSGYTAQIRALRNYARLVGRRSTPNGALPDDPEEHARPLTG